MGGELKKFKNIFQICDWSFRVRPARKLVFGKTASSEPLQGVRDWRCEARLELL
jgi:hypothetical protein